MILSCFGSYLLEGAHNCWIPGMGGLPDRGHNLGRLLGRIPERSLLLYRIFKALAR